MYTGSAQILCHVLENTCELRDTGTCGWGVLEPGLMGADRCEERPEPCNARLSVSQVETAHPAAREEISRHLLAASLPCHFGW